MNVSHVHVCFLLFSAVDCGFLVPPIFGNVRTTLGSVFTSVATYTCNEGYMLVGSATRTCQETAEWTGEIPLCDRKKLCDPFPN